MQIKKAIAAGAMGLMMLGTTVFAGTLADLPQPFVTSAGALDTLVVVGANAQVSDVVGAIDVAARLGSESTTLVSVGGTTGTATISSGEGQASATTNTKVYLDDHLKKSGLKTTMTGTELPTLLASGTLTDDDASDSYNYDQYIDLSDDYSVKFAQWIQPDGSTTDPDLTLEAASSKTGTVSTTNYLYKSRIVFEKDVNVSTAAGETLSVFGGTYTISSSTTSSKLVLFGSSNSQTMSEGQEVTVTIGGTAYTIKLEGVSSTTQAVVSVNGVSKEITEDATTTVNGLEIYADGIYFYNSDTQIDQAKLSFGSQTMTLENAKRVKIGTGSGDYIDGTYVAITSSSGKISMVEVYTTGGQSSRHTIKKGTTFADPVWGSFELNFASATPDLMSSAKEKIEVGVSGDSDLTVSFADESGNTASIIWGHITSTSDTTPELTDADNDRIIVAEGVPVELSQYFTSDAGDYGHLFEVTSLDSSSTADSTTDMEITDKFSGTSYTIVLGSDRAASKVIDGQTYYFNATTSNVTVTWGGSASGVLEGVNSTSSVGTYATVFPRIKTSKGAYIALTETDTTINVTNGLIVELPTGALTVTFDESKGTSKYINLTATARESDAVTSVCDTTPCASINASDATASIDTFALGRTSTGGQYYRVGVPTYSATQVSLNFTLVDDDGSTAEVNPGILLVEELDDSNNQYTVFVSGSTEASGSNQVVRADAPDFTYAEHSASLKSDTYRTQYVDIFGVVAERNTNDQDTVDIYYPDEQVTMDLFVLKTGATVATSGATSSTTIAKAVPVTSSVAKMDTQVTAADKSEKNIILVGGPCVNSIVADLLNAAWGSENACSEWANQYTAGESIIQLVDNAFGTGTSAMIIAGTNADDTVEATGVFQQYDTKSLSGSLVKIKSGVITTVTA